MSSSFIQPDIDLSQMPEPCSQELKSASKKSHNLLAINQNPTIGDLISCKRFGDLQKLLRVTASSESLQVQEGTHITLLADTDTSRDHHSRVTLGFACAGEACSPR